MGGMRREGLEEVVRSDGGRVCDFFLRSNCEGSVQNPADSDPIRPSKKPTVAGGSGCFGLLDNARSSIAYEKFCGNKLDREMLKLLQA